MEKLRDLGFQVTVDDEGGFWDSRNLGKLAATVRQYDSMVAGFAEHVVHRPGRLRCGRAGRRR